MRQEIRDAILRGILEGTYKPGERLTELELARKFETSQAPVREALCELEALGHVESAPFRGTYVRSVPPDEIRDAHRLRALLEREAAEAAARRTDVDWDEVRVAVDAADKAAARGGIKGYARRDERFHRAIVERSGNPVLLRHWELLLGSTRFHAIVAAGLVDLCRTANEHRPILEALEQHDAARAGRLAYEHANRFVLPLETVASVKEGEGP